MADAMDFAQQREQEDRERHISNARNKKTGISRLHCIDCDPPIPSARRRAPVCSAVSHVKRLPN